ncbi:flagellar biosynthetic protein FliO [Beggiatoa alba]|nr:flagellar biosynthetic protein FliO [Beggiatoa alba]
MMLRIFGFFFFLLASSLALAEDATLSVPGEKINQLKELSAGGFSDPNIAGNLIQTTLGLLVVLVVIAAVAWGFKRFGHFQSGMQGKLKVIGGISLGSRERVVLLQVGNQQLVVGVAPGQIRTLHVLDEPLSVEVDKSQGTSFSSRLQSAMSNRATKKFDNISNKSNTA